MDSTHTQLSKIPSSSAQTPTFAPRGVVGLNFEAFSNEDGIGGIDTSDVQTECLLGIDATANQKFFGSTLSGTAPGATNSQPVKCVWVTQYTVVFSISPEGQLACSK